MKILYIAPFDMAANSGGGIACRSYYNAVKALYPDSTDLMMFEEDCRGEYADAIRIPARKGLQYLTDPGMHRGNKFIKQFLRENGDQYDICVANCSRYCGDLIDDFHKYGIKVITIHHNYEVEYCMDNKSMFTLKGLFSGLIKWIEGNAYRKSDVNCFLTKNDQDKISKEYGYTNAYNYLLGVFEPAPQILKSSKTVNNDTLVFTGSMCDYQTYHSVEIFGRDFLDTFMKKFPTLKLLIAGRNPHESVYKLQKKYPKVISVVANPVNINDVIDRASVFFCPTCIGSGLKLRLMDGLKKGLPVLVHCVSARGYDSFFGNPFFQIYETPETFEKGLNTILEFIKDNRNYQDEIIRIYADNFSFESGVNRFSEVIKLIKSN